MNCPECIIRMFLKAVKGGTFKLANPIHENRTERQSGRLSVWTFFTAEPKCVYTCAKNLCVNKSFSLVCCFLDKIKNLKQNPGDSCVLIFNINAQTVYYLIILPFEVRTIYVHSGFFLWFLLIPFIHVKERKMKDWNYAQINSQSNQTIIPKQWGKESISELSIKVT